MIRRPVRVTFRMTHEEAATFKDLIHSAHCWDWSNLIRTALRFYADAQATKTTDNGVRQNGPIMSDRRSPVRQRKNGSPSKAGKRRKIAKK
jgi:hypothetical protein